MKNTSNRPTSYQSRTYIQKAVIANRRIRKGDITRVANSTGYSLTHCSDVIAGKEFNTKIMNACFDMVRSRIQNSEMI
jgi:hypothetical protein